MSLAVAACGGSGTATHGAARGSDASAGPALQLRATDAGGLCIVDPAYEGYEPLYPDAYAGAAGWVEVETFGATDEIAADGRIPEEAGPSTYFVELMGVRHASGKESSRLVEGLVLSARTGLVDWLPQLRAAGATRFFIPVTERELGVATLLGSNLLIEWDSGYVSPLSACQLVSTFDDALATYTDGDLERSAHVFRSIMQLDGADPELGEEYLRSRLGDVSGPAAPTTDVVEGSTADLEALHGRDCTPRPQSGSDEIIDEAGLEFFGDPEWSDLIRVNRDEFVQFFREFPQPTAPRFEPVPGRFEVAVGGTTVLAGDAVRETGPKLLDALPPGALDRIAEGLIMISRQSAYEGWTTAYVAIDDEGHFHPIGVCDALWVVELAELAGTLSEQESRDVTPIDALVRLHDADAAATNAVLGIRETTPWTLLGPWDRSVRPQQMDDSSLVGVASAPARFEGEGTQLPDGWILCSRIVDFAWGDCTQVDALPIWLRPGATIEIWALPNGANRSVTGTVYGVPDHTHADARAIGSFEANDLLRLAEDGLVTIMIAAGEATLKPS